MTPNGAQERRPDGAAFIIALVLVALGALLIWDGGRIPNKAGYSGVGPCFSWVRHCMAGVEEPRSP
jgi:putative tricarboxylic transport membrane protein